MKELRPKKPNEPVESILERAQEIIYGDREKTYGAPDKNLRAIAELWETYIQAKYNVNVPINTDDVCYMMVLLKVARLANDPMHKDSQIDICGYAALAERVQVFIASHSVVSSGSGNSK